MADVAFRSDDFVFFPRHIRRGGANGRGGSDRFVARTEGGAERPWGEGVARPVPWPVVPRRDLSFDVMVAPSSTIPAVVVLPRATTAAPFGDEVVTTAPAIRIGPEARCPVPVDPRRRGIGVFAAAATHLVCLAALLAMPRIEPAGGGVETEAVEIAIVFAEDSLDAEAGAASFPREAPPEPVSPDPVPVEPVSTSPSSVEGPPRDAAAATPIDPVAPSEPARRADPVAQPGAEEPPASDHAAVVATAAPAETAVPPLPAAPVTANVPPPPAPVIARVEPQKSPVRAAPNPQPVKSERRVEVKPRSPVASPPGKAARDSTSGARTAGTAAAAGTGAVADWRAAVLAALARAKRYPDDARDRGVTGRAVVGFTVSGDGSVSAVALVASSGVAALDAATLAMPRRASFPPMPAGGPSTQSFTAGVRYDLR